MSELSYLILASLAEGRQHGYGVLVDIEDFAGPAARPQVATLYRTLDRLVADGHVAVDGTDVVEGRFRRYYRLTAGGASALDDQLVHWTTVTRVVRRRLNTLHGAANPVVSR